MQICGRGIAGCHAHQQTLNYAQRELKNSCKEGNNDKAQECMVNMRPEDIFAQLIPLVECFKQNSKIYVKVLDGQR